MIKQNRYPMELTVAIAHTVGLPEMANATIDDLWRILWIADSTNYVESGEPMFPGIAWIKTATGVRPHAS